MDNKGQDMFFECVDCKKRYEERDEDHAILGKMGCSMVCYECCKYYRNTEKNYQPERLNPETQYPDGTMWQDNSSLDEEGLVNMYVRRKGDWIFGFKAKPINIFSPV